MNPRREGKEQYHAIVFRSGKEVKEPRMSTVITQAKEAGEKDKVEVESNKKELEEKEAIARGMKPTLVVPFPQRLKGSKLNWKFEKFLDIVKKLHINTPFADALEQMPSYEKFMKKILEKKKKLGEFEMLHSLRSVVQPFRGSYHQRKIREASTSHVLLRTLHLGKALCDLGESINLMPLSIFIRLRLSEAKATTVTLQLADRSLKHPRGIIENDLVKVGKFIFLEDLIVSDMEEDEEILIILG